MGPGPACGAQPGAGARRRAGEVKLTEMRMNDAAQPICGCRACGCRRIVYLCDTYNEHSNSSTLSHYRCNDCGSVFVGNEIDSDELASAYSTLDPDSYYREIGAENRRKMATAISDLKALISEKSSLIDIGTGDGSFVELLHDAGFEHVSAHEIEGSDLSGIRGIAEEIFQDHDYRSIPSDRFDAVTLLDVVEHVLDPRFLVGACARILKRGGLIYLHTPVVTRADRLMHCVQKVPVLGKVGTIWQRGRTSIFHLQNYTPRSLRLLLEGAGFRDIEIEVKNELSWPVRMYVEVYLLSKQGLPACLAGIIAPLLYPLLATRLLNANKAIVSARKR